MPDMQMLYGNEPAEFRVTRFIAACDADAVEEDAADEERQHAAVQAETVEILVLVPPTVAALCHNQRRYQREQRARCLEVNEEGCWVPKGRGPKMFFLVLRQLQRYRGSPDNGAARVAIFGDDRFGRRTTDPFDDDGEDVILR